MTEAWIDYEAVYRALPGMVALLTPDLVYADVNAAFLRGTGRSRESIVGRYLFDVFPENPDDPEAGARVCCTPRCCGSCPPVSATPWPYSATTSRRRSTPDCGRSATGAR
ncbi:hypothetical protein SHKM778_59310 [Streptomyces sp. KM77-8]|uniref:PAS fold-4 domain-containing protein n=1 Tax=Streptomyces haneummycinicus TaxID=3074435 RepID=A0AAT9HQ10_9ACTN